MEPPPPTETVATEEVTGLPDTETAATPADPRAERRERYTRDSEYPIFVLSLAFVAGFFLQFTSEAVEQEVGRVLLVIAWAGFVIDYLISLALAASRRQFIRSHLLLLVAILFPPLRFLLLARAIKGLAHQSRNRFGGRIRVYLLYLTTLMVVLSAMLEVFFERMSPSSNINSFGDALWWTTETISTVGYGDYYPVTVPGRLVAVALFVNGIALLSVITATLAGRVLGDAGDKGEDATVTLNDLNGRLRSIEEAIAALMASLPDGQPVAEPVGSGGVEPVGAESRP